MSRTLLLAPVVAIAIQGCIASAPTLALREAAPASDQTLVVYRAPT